MKSDEFAFFNQQLASMVRDGIPLEAALRRLCAEMRSGSLRGELEKLGDDLARGIPLRDAVRARQLPELYRQMLEVGAQSNDLPGVLTMMADHYQQTHLITTRLKGLMVYPSIVLICSLLLSIFFAILTNYLRFSFVAIGWHRPTSDFAQIGPWLSPVILAVAVIGLVVAFAPTQARRFLRWRLPAFKEASLTRVASAIALMLKAGVQLDDALGLVAKLEHGTSAEAELALWRQRLASGQGRLSEMASGGKVFPPLFVWTVSQAREDLASGFQRAADIYRGRANYRTELLMYSALPCAIIALALMILLQVIPAAKILVELVSYSAQT